MLHHHPIAFFIIITSGALAMYYFIFFVVNGSWGRKKDTITAGLPLSSLFKRKWLPVTKPLTKDPAGDPDENRKQLQTIVHDLVDELQAYFLEQDESISKEQILFFIKQILQKYPTIHQSIYQEGISQLIGVSAKNNCSVHFSEEEISEVWK